MQNQEPDEAQDQLRLAIHDVGRVDVNDLDAFTFQELQCNSDVFKLLRTEGRTSVVLAHPLL